MRRLRPPNENNWFGTDSIGRDIYSRVLYGTRVSLLVGFSVAILSTSVGLVIGLAAGFNRFIDAIVMRVMDGLMSIPPVLLAIALMALTKASIQNVILAITIAEVPRVSRLVRSLGLSLREQPFVEAARATGTRSFRILWRHILPNTVAPLIVQATYVCASAIIVEAILSFLGAGTPPTTPSWGISSPRDACCSWSPPTSFSSRASSSRSRCSRSISSATGCVTRSIRGWRAPCERRGRYCAFGRAGQSAADPCSRSRI